jgi:fibronectin type 3 domain-containing protein
VTFTPAVIGTETGTITITSNAQSSSITIGLQASGVSAGDHSATVYWIGSVSPVTGYFVYRSTSSGGPYRPLIAAPHASLTYTDLAVLAGQTYYYVVTAVNSDNIQSSYSNEVSATIPTP